MKDLKAADSRIADEWQDEKIREIEHAFLEPLEPNVRTAILAIAELAELLAKAERIVGSD